MGLRFWTPSLSVDGITLPGQDLGVIFTLALRTKPAILPAMRLNEFPPPYEMKRRRQAIRPKLSIENLAIMIGVRPSTVSRWERGRLRPHRIKLKAWDDALTNAEVFSGEAGGRRK